jgi:hypothetical protein
MGGLGLRPSLNLPMSVDANHLDVLFFYGKEVAMLGELFENDAMNT